MYLRFLAAAPLAALALGVAACGGDDGTPASAQSARDSNRQAELKLAQCMREQGVDFPDPQSGGQQGPVKVGGDASPEELREAAQACEKYRRDIKPPELTEEQQQEFKQAALEHARCMRDHGIDFPDPTFSEDGGAQVRIGPGGVDPNDDDFKAAEKACGEKLSSAMERQP